MGTSLELRVAAETADAARRAEEHVLQEIDRLSAILSGYDQRSELSRWQSASNLPTKVSPELAEVLQACDNWREWSGGAFDPRVEALTRLWSRCAHHDRLPVPGELAAARALMSAPAWRVDPDSRTAVRLSDCPISLSGIAKGYIVERASEAAMRKDRRVRGLLLNVGGDLRLCGAMAQPIGVASPWADSESSEPLTFIEVKDRSVATSGNSQRGLRINGHWYSHIFDPRSGMPVDRVTSATVIAHRGADADALAKVFSVLPPEESVRLASTLPGVECLIITSDGQAARSSGWHKYERLRPAVLARRDDSNPGPLETKSTQDGKQNANEPRAPWNKGFELVVNFEINSPGGQGGRYRRPYVAIWVEGRDGFPVRTLALWVSMGGSGPFQWLPDLKRWYRSDQQRKLVDKQELLFTVARPTRPPGKYKVIWDGRDDHGKQQGSGPYTIFIEAAREHGTYQSIRKPLVLSDQPFSEELKGNVEIKSASIEYRRKAPAK
jgi:thiamine biosynthesis lipoprotein ApbE